jgi:hypothetical protein
VFNLDETALFYKLMPGTSLATTAINGIKQSKERLTIAFCVNTDGSERLKAIVIHKYKIPRCFAKTFDPNLICYYYYNQSEWMNTFIFSNRLTAFNRKMALSNRKVLLLVDNAAAHNVTDDY